MVDAARQMLDELMGRNRNLHPSEAPKTISWDDPEFCQYYIVKFCPHDLFVNTRADLGPCYRIHDDEAKRMYDEAKPSHRKRQYEDEFLEFCNSMLNDVDRKIQKGKQRLELMQKDQPAGQSHVSKYQEQLNTLSGRIKKLLSEAEEAGIRGDVDQAQDLMNLCEQLKEERDSLLSHHESLIKESILPSPAIATAPAAAAAAAAPLLALPLATAPTVVEGGASTSPLAAHANDSGPDKESTSQSGGGEKSSPPPTNDGEGRRSATATPGTNTVSEQQPQPQQPTQLHGTVMEKQMEVCEVCGAFLIVGDVQQRIEDHLMGKQHLGFSKLRKVVQEIHERRRQERQDGDHRRYDERAGSRGRHQPRHRDSDRKRGGNDVGRGKFGDRGRNEQKSGASRYHQHNDRHKRHHHKSSSSRHHGRSDSRSRSYRRSRDRRHSRSFSRSRSRH